MPEFQTWVKATPSSPESLLWVTAVPGAGKSVLCTFVIDHLQNAAGTDSWQICYYMFDGRTIDKCSPISATCSLVYQLLNGSADLNTAFLDELDCHRRESGQGKVTDFVPLWTLLGEHIRKLSRLTIILDGLDECDNSVRFVEGIIELLRGSNMKVIIFSRREAELAELLDHFLQLKFAGAENYSDISSFLQTEISNSTKLSSLSVKRQVYKRFDHDIAELLSARSNRSFLWAKSALKELGSRATTHEIVAALGELPSGIIPFYESILEGYNKRLTLVQRRICCMVLRWLVCASRPLSGMDLWAVIRSEYLQLARAGGANWDVDDSSDEDSDNDFHFSCREIMEVCGSLIVTNEELMQLAHVSIAEFLSQKPQAISKNQQIYSFFVDPPATNLHLTTVCLHYLKETLGRPPIRSDERGNKHRFDAPDLSKPFLAYAVRQWLVHFMQIGLSNLDAAEVGLKDFLLGPKMLYWLEMWFVIEGPDLWTLQHLLGVLSRRCASRRQIQMSGNSVATLVYVWSEGILQLLERHGSALEEMPSEIHFIDPRSYCDNDEGMFLFEEFALPEPAVHTPHFKLKSESFPRSVGSAASRNCLQPQLPCNDRLLLRPFYVDENRCVIFMGTYMTRCPELRCQEIKNGRLLKPIPAVCDCGTTRYFFCEGFSMSRDGKHLAILYRSYLLQAGTPSNNRYDINVWEIPNVLDSDHMGDKPWCKIVSVVSIEHPSRGYSPRPIVFDENNILYSPFGSIKIGGPSLHARSCGIDAMAADVMLDIPRIVIDLEDVCFSADGRFMIAYRPEILQITRYSTKDMTLDAVITVSARQLMICCVSFSGCLIVWGDTTSPYPTYYLQDLSRSSCTLLPMSEAISMPPCFFLEFSLDEKYLLGVVKSPANPDSHYVVLWSVSGGAIHKARSKAITPISSFHFRTAENAYLAANGGWLQINPQNLNCIPASLDSPTHSGNYVGTGISDGGDRLAIVMIEDLRYVASLSFCNVLSVRSLQWLLCYLMLDNDCTIPIQGLNADRNDLYRIELEIIYLAANYRSRKTSLQLPKNRALLNPPYRVAFSRDLELISVNGACYRLSTDLEFDRLVLSLVCQSGFTSNLGTEQGSPSGSHILTLPADFSSCNRFVAHTDTGSVEPARQPSLQVFTLGTRGCKVQVPVDLPTNLDISKVAYVVTAWHPTSPILSVVTWEINPEPGQLLETKKCYTWDMDGPTARWLESKRTFRSGVPSRSSHSCECTEV